VVFIHYYKEKGKWKKYLIGKIREIEEQRHNETIMLIDNISAKIPIQFKKRY
jgi:hypothetical protein